MSNSCDNWLVLAGPTEEVAGFMHFAASAVSAFDFRKFILLPAKAIGLGREDKEDVKREHWGTPENACQVDLDWGFTLGGGCKARYHFKTNWSPPVPVVLAASARFPLLPFVHKYRRSVDNIEGVLGVRAGVVRFDRRRRFEGYCLD